MLDTSNFIEVYRSAKFMLRNSSTNIKSQANISMNLIEHITDMCGFQAPILSSHPQAHGWLEGFAPLRILELAMWIAPMDFAPPEEVGPSA